MPLAIVRLSVYLSFLSQILTIILNSMTHEQVFKEMVVENCPHKNYYDDGKLIYCQKKYTQKCKQHEQWIDFDCPKDCPKLPKEIGCTPDKCKYITNLITEFKRKIK